MSAGMIEHWGMVKRIDDGRATVVVETTTCSVCGHGGYCGIGKVAAGGQAALLSLPAANGLKEGDFVNVGLSASRLSLAAMIGFFFPVLTTLIGAGLGVSLGGSDGTAALGAASGFVASLVVARLAIAFTPGLSPAPRIIPTPSLSPTFPQEHDHD